MINITSNIDQVIERFKAKANQTSNVDVSQALLAGVNAARGAMTNRIFNKGLDSNKTTLGPYKGKKAKTSTAKARAILAKKKKADFFTTNIQGDFSEYELIRIDHGRQIRYKDLELTGTLKRGIVTIKENENRVVCAIPNNKLFLISQGQEKQIHTIIFQLTDEERELLKTNTQEILKQIYDNILNG